MRKVRLHCSKRDTATVVEWFGACRATYNNALQGIKEDEEAVNLVELRKSYVNADALTDEDKYLLRTPKHVRDGALMDLVAAFKSNFAKKKVNPNHRFEVQYRSKKEQEQSIVIPSAAIGLMAAPGALKMYPKSVLDPIRFHTRAMP